MAWDRWDRPFFPPSKPIAAKGGIRARSKRGAFVTSWWGKRWLSVLEALNLGGRLERARSYARRGQVLDLEIMPGKVRARVQGSRPKPYAITISMKQLDAAQNARLAAALSRNPYCLARLIAREMPPEIEEVFAASGVSLFPQRASELKTDCSCPDWSNPCKHIAAVYYLLSEEFDRDPFLVFRLRGIDADALTGPTPQAEEEVEAELEPAEPLTAEHFWEAAVPAELDLAATRPRDPAALLRMLGNLPFWRGEQPLAESLERAYGSAQDAASG